MKKDKNDEINPLKELRTRRSLTQQKLSDMTEVSKTTISNVESGKHKLSLVVQRVIAEALSLYDDWYTKPNFKEKIKIDETMKDILKHIKNNVDNDIMARHILQNLKTLIDTEGLSKDERKIYSEYIYVIIRDLAIVATEAKKHIKNEDAEDMVFKTNKVAYDIMNLPGIHKSKYNKILIKEESLLKDFPF